MRRRRWLLDIKTRKVGLYGYKSFLLDQSPEPYIYDYVKMPVFSGLFGLMERPGRHLDGKPWRVIHVPTGMMAASFDHKRQALRFIVLAFESNTDWKCTDQKNIPAETKDTCYMLRLKTVNAHRF